MVTGNETKQATIVEIPVPVRDWKSAVMVFGVWLASTKPPRDLFLQPIVNQLENLMNSKILIKQKDGIIDSVFNTICKLNIRSFLVV